MRTGTIQHNGRAVFTRKHRVAGAALALLVGGLALGCDDDAFQEAFISGAGDQFQSGVESIVLGFVSGTFAAIESSTGDGSSASSGSSSGSSAGTTTPSSSDSSGSSADSSGSDTSAGDGSTDSGGTDASTSTP